MTPEQERRVVDLLARSVVLLAGVVAGARDLAIAASRQDPAKAADLALEFRDLASEAEPLLDAAEQLTKEIGGE